MSLSSNPFYSAFSFFAKLCSLIYAYAIRTTVTQKTAAGQFVGGSSIAGVSNVNGPGVFNIQSDLRKFSFNNGKHY